MSKPLYNLEQLVQFRQHMHENAEIGFFENQTQQNIMDFLRKLGVKDTQMTKCAKTGIYVDLFGQQKSEGPKKLIAFRADIDALETFEGNENLSYRSKVKAAHLCGHDGHTTCLLGFAAKYLEKISEIPSNLGVRLLFQPCEEGTRGSPGGALEMIKDGCLKDVQEVYGFHNWPTDLVGHCYVKPGPVMAEIIHIEIKILGKGGHGSEPSKCNDPIQPAIDIHNYVRELVKNYEKRKINFRLTMPHIEAGSACNVIPDSAFLEGTFRSFDEKFSKEFVRDFSKKVDEFCAKHSCKSEKNIRSLYPAVTNSAKETNDILKLAQEYFGKENVDDRVLPIYASEDFAYFLKERPGTFFFLCSAKKENDDYLHTANFNFNDDLIPLAADFWVKIAEQRLGLDQTVFNIRNLEPKKKEINAKNTKKTEKTKKLAAKSAKKDEAAKADLKDGSRKIKKTRK